jgi:hypothetical protein
MSATQKPRAFVYVISAGDGVRKIGFSRRPKERRGMLQSQSDYTLTGEVAFECSPMAAPYIERAAHRRLASARVEGEWFTVDAETAIATIKAAANDVGEAVSMVPFPSTEEEQAPSRRGRYTGRNKNITALISPDALAVLDAEITARNAASATAKRFNRSEIIEEMILALGGGRQR